MIKVKFVKDRGRRKTGEIASYDANSAQVIIDEGAAVAYVEPVADEPAAEPVAEVPVLDPATPTDVVPGDLSPLPEEQAEPASKPTRRPRAES